MTLYPTWPACTQPCSTPLRCGNVVRSAKLCRGPPVQVAWCQKGDKPLTHWGRATHICVCKLAIIGSDNGLSPGRRQAIIWTNDGILLIGPLGTNFSEILIGIQTFSSRKMHLKISSAKWRPFFLGLNTLMEEMSKSKIPDAICHNEFSLRYGDRSGPTLAQVMAWCRHYH